MKCHENVTKVINNFNKTKTKNINLIKKYIYNFEVINSIKNIKKYDIKVIF